MPSALGRTAFLCGEGGIRTHGTIASTRTFQARSFGHSDTSPKLGLLFFLLNIYFNMGNTNFLSLLARPLFEGVLQTDNYPILQPFLSEGKQKYQISVNIEEIYDFLTNA